MGLIAAKPVRTRTLLSEADTARCAQYQRRLICRKSVPISLPFITFPYLFEKSYRRDMRIFSDLPVISVASLERLTRSGPAESASRTGNETGVPHCLTSTLYSSTGYEFYFLPNVSKCLISSHFRVRKPLFSQKTEGPEVKQALEIRGVSFLRDQGRTATLQTNRINHNTGSALVLERPRT